MIHVKRLPAGSDRSPVGLRYTFIAVMIAGGLCTFSLLAPGVIG